MTTALSTRAAVLREAGAPPVVTELPRPQPGPGEALVRVEAAALNPVELHISSGRFFDGPPRFPYVPGVEGAGVVEAGERLAPGTRVRFEIVHPGYGRDGGVAQHVVVPELPESSDRSSQAIAFPIPDHLGDVEAAALGAVGGTALMLLERAIEAGAELEGSTVVVLAATGAIGRSAIQLARRMGARRVVAVGRNEARLSRARELGAAATVRLSADGAGESGLRDRIVAAAEGGADVVLDPLWGEPARAAIEALASGGVLVNFGQAAAATAELPSLPLRNRRVTLVGHSGAWTTPEERRATFERLLAATEREPLTLDTEELSLAQVGEGWRRLARSAGAKLVVRPWSG